MRGGEAGRGTATAPGPRATRALKLKRPPAAACARGTCGGRLGEARVRRGPEPIRRLRSRGRPSRVPPSVGAGQRRFVAAFALVLALGEARHRGDALAVVEADESHALSVAADHADLAHAQSDHLAAAGDEPDLIVVRDHADADDAA